jgi:mersacidin/lichenicidin family type 2 lantibiotic
MAERRRLWAEVYQKHKTIGEKIMTNKEIIRSWKDDTYLQNLGHKERTYLPDNPAGLIELTDEELLGVDGGTTSLCIISAAKVTFYVSAAVSAITAAIYTASR